MTDIFLFPGIPSLHCQSGQTYFSYLSPKESMVQSCVGVPKSISVISEVLQKSLAMFGYIPVLFRATKVIALKNQACLVRRDCLERSRQNSPQSHVSENTHLPKFSFCVPQSSSTQIQMLFQREVQHCMAPVAAPPALSGSDFGFSSPLLSTLHSKNLSRGSSLAIFLPFQHNCFLR